MAEMRARGKDRNTNRDPCLLPRTLYVDYDGINGMVMRKRRRGRDGCGINVKNIGRRLFLLRALIV